MNIVKLSELELKNRIDAEFYSPEYMNIMNKLRKLECVRIGKCCFVTSGSTPLDRDPELKSGIVLLKTANIREGYIDIYSEKPFFIDENLDERLKSSRLKPNDVLINIVGATLEVIGRVAIVPDDFPRTNITQAMSLIRLETEDFLPEYVFAFLYSKYGRKQVCRIARPTAQYNLNHEETKRIIIPKIAKKFQNMIRDIWRNFYSFYDKSINLYSQAESLLLEKLRLKNFEPKYELSYTTNLSKAFGVNRVDAEYFQPAYDEIINYLKTEIELKNIIHLVNKQETKIHPIPQKVYKYIEISDIRTDIGQVTYTERLGSELPPNARIPISGGELLVSKVRPTRKAIGIVPNCLNKNVICSSAFTVFDIPSPLKEYIFVLLRSVVGKLQLERPTTGTEYPTLKDSDVENILIPIVSDEFQQKIASLVQQSYDARRKAQEFLEETKEKVEEAIVVIGTEFQ